MTLVNHFIQILGSVAAKMIALLGCIACIHLIAAIGFAIGGPLLGLAGYFIGIAVAISLVIYLSERPCRSNQR